MTKNIEPHKGKTHQPDIKSDYYAEFTERPGAALSKERKIAQKKIVLFTVAAVLLVVAVGAIIAWFILATNRGSDENGSDAQKQIFYKDTVSAARSEVEGEFIFVDSVTSLGGQTKDGSIVYDFAPYQVDGMAFKSLPVTGTGFAVSVAQDKADEQYGLLVKFFDSHKDKFQPQDIFVTGAGGLSVQSDGITIENYKMFVSSDAVCSLAKLANLVSSYKAISLGCAGISSYQESAQTAAVLYQAAKKADSKNASILTLSNPNIVDGKNGAKRAFVYQKGSESGTNGLYAYYQNPNAAWQQFGVIPESGSFTCSQFASAVLKAAFDGMSCESSTGTFEKVKL